MKPLTGIEGLFVEELRRQLRTEGYCYFHGSELPLEAESYGDQQVLRSVFDYGVSDGSMRQRYFSRYVLPPRIGIETLNLSTSSCLYLSSDYAQSSGLNPEQQGATRCYAPLPADLCSNGLLKNLILFDLALVPIADFWRNAGRNPIAMGIHLIRMVAEPGRPSVPSPSIPHQDGEPFTCIHLVSRQGVQGGLSQVFRNAPQEGINRPGELLAEFALSNLFDTLVVWDKAVFHHVTPVEVGEDRPSGTRDVLILDFTPLEECKFDHRGKIGIDDGVFGDRLLA